MKLRLTAACAALATAALATSALAEQPVMAKLQAPTAGSVRPVAGDAVFDCLGDVCAARAPSSDTASVNSCKELVRQVGAVTAFGTSSRQFTAEQLTRCNQSAKK